MLSSTAMSKQSDGVSSLKTKDLNVSWMILNFSTMCSIILTDRFCASWCQPGRRAWAWGNFVSGEVSPTSRWVASIRTTRTPHRELCCPANSPDSLSYNLSVNSSEWLTCNRAQCPAWTWRPGWARWWRHSWLDRWVGPAQLFSSRYSSHFSKKMNLY